MKYDPDYAKNQLENFIKKLEKNEVIQLSTCRNWEMGSYCSSEQQKLAIHTSPICNKLSYLGYRVNVSVNHGVTDYVVYPKEEALWA